MLLFTSPAAGEKFGYTFDGWHEDGTFHYTGEGQTGDQVMKDGNKATLNHKWDGRALRLFQKDGVDVIYLGEFELPLESPYLIDEGPDLDGNQRAVFVFRLAPVGEVLRTAEFVVDSRPTELIPIESSDIEKYVLQRPGEPVDATRAEAMLVRRYEEWLHKEHEQQAFRHRIRTEAGAAMYTDLYNYSTEELIEAKSSASRHHVRYALGQILDYARYVKHESLAVLLPSRPAESLVELLTSHGVAVIYEYPGAGFLRSAPPQN